jgi:arylsulfatase A-like enzyme
MKLLTAMLSLGLITAGVAAPANKSATRPNILVILADDLGFSDLGCFGGEIQTPNLDRLAAEGLRFTNFHNTTRCCPSRASLLTGLYPHQAGIGRMTSNNNLPGYQGQIRADTPTIAEVLKATGYHTAMAGKWHVSLTDTPPGHMKNLNNQVVRDTFAEVASYPINRGFESYYGIIWGVADYFDPFSLVDGASAVRAVPKDFYLTDAIADHVIVDLENFHASAQPFFIYAAFTAPHWPLQARPEDIAKYRDTYLSGWDALRQARYERQLKLGLFQADTATLSPRADAERPWASVSDKAWESAAMAVHAAMVDRMDQQIGRILAKLKELGQLDNTLIIFLSDNGASPEEPKQPGFDRPSETRDGRPIRYGAAMRKQNILPGPDDTFASIGPMWANAANTPFRYWKAETYEGGVATPLIIHWPAGLKAHGEINREPGHIIDLLPTALEVSGAKFPAQFAGHAPRPPEGVSLVPTFTGQPLPREALFWEHEGNFSVQMGEWKAVNSVAGGGRWELYDLAKDRTETRDLAVVEPFRLSRMIAAWQTWAERTDVLPAPPLPPAHVGHGRVIKK